MSRCSVKPVVIAAGSGDFCGSGKNKTRVLNALGKLGYEVHYVCTQRPHLLSQLDDVNFSVHIVGPVRSDFLGSDNGLSVFAIVDKLTQLAASFLRIPSTSVILWGTYLFPYVQAAITAKQVIYDHLNIDVPLISTPAGSDVWQIGPQCPSSARHLLFGQSIDKCLAYSNVFRDEIYHRFGNDGHIEVIPPLLDMTRFSPATAEQKRCIREDIGIGSDHTVIVTHSNMRPVKNVSLIFDVVEQVAAGIASSRPLHLLLVGPKPASVPSGHRLEQVRQGEPLHCTSNLTVHWVGLQSCVQRYLNASDIALNFSLHDSFNISLLEAMACGLPSMTTDVTGIAADIHECASGYVIQTEIAGRLLDGIDNPRLSTPHLFTCHEDVVQQMYRLIMDQNLRFEMGERGARFVRQHYAEQVVIAQYEKLIEEVSCKCLRT